MCLLGSGRTILMYFIRGAKGADVGSAGELQLI